MSTILTETEMQALLDVVAFDCSSPTLGTVTNYAWLFKDTRALSPSSIRLRNARLHLKERKRGT